MRSRNPLLYFIPLCVSSVLSSCDESLPPRDQPPTMFSAALRARYDLTANTNGVAVTAVLTNVFDETLQGPLLLTGEVEFTWMRFPDIKKTVQLSSIYLAYARRYNGLTGELTIDPGDSIIVSYVWQIMSDTLRNQIFLFRGDMSCVDASTRPMRSIAEPETFLVTGQVRVFRNTALVPFGTVEVSFCAVTTWLPSRDCATPQTTLPCGP